MPKVKEVVEDSPAAKAGLQAGDRILKFDGQAGEQCRSPGGLDCQLSRKTWKCRSRLIAAGKPYALKGHADVSSQGEFGFKLGKPEDKVDGFVKITEIAKDSAAEKAGFAKWGDEIIGIEDARLTMPVKQQFLILEAFQKNGVLAFQPVNIRIRRQKDSKDRGFCSKGAGRRNTRNSNCGLCRNEGSHLAPRAQSASLKTT